MLLSSLFCAVAVMSSSFAWLVNHREMRAAEPSPPATHQADAPPPEHDVRLASAREWTVSL